MHLMLWVLLLLLLQLELLLLELRLLQLLLRWHWLWMTLTSVCLSLLWCLLGNVLLSRLLEPVVMRPLWRNLGLLWGRMVGVGGSLCWDCRFRVRHPHVGRTSSQLSRISGN
ncbi:hypothetical protein BZA05DRAFT_392923 [Tricharina praecox]|uniref:uncharacterized protein n=1 Tax=Tricharina praecox TaxID=43433 RepID=UPI00221E6F17|nr:uncharacterized protein BZA05DRAFT_392923 [Tricharina praecox]KAI5854908.1 hypothetical protein BZA05DRAFT_392923 [Tricharina praecox]